MELGWGCFWCLHLPYVVSGCVGGGRGGEMYASVDEGFVEFHVTDVK